MKSAQLTLKWIVDRVLAAFGLVVLAPVFAAIWVWVRRDAGKPVFISQLRAGKNGVPFRLLKVRSMVPDAVRVGQELGITDDPFGVVPEDPRITKSGRVLRRTGLDELPQLVEHPPRRDERGRAPAGPRRAGGELHGGGPETTGRASRPDGLVADARP